jgi:uncharacterized protein YndB with AHSA1/START domain
MTDTDGDLGEVIIERDFDAPRGLVFECMTTPAHLANFWGPPGISTPLGNITLDLRPGGVFETTMVNDETGDEYPNLGVYVEVDPPNRISFSEKGDAEGMTTSVDFVDLGDGRTHTVTHQTNVPAMYRSPEALAGFEASLDRFAGYLATIT